MRLSLPTLLLAAAIPAGAATTTTWIDDFNVDGLVEASTSAASISTDTLTNFTRKLSARYGTTLKKTTLFVDSASGILASSSGTGINAETSVLYTAIGGSIDLTPGSSTASSSVINVNFTDADTASSFTWTATDTQGRTATWTQSFPSAANANILYTKALDSFVNGTAIDWSNVATLFFQVATVTAIDYQFTGGFSIESTLANPVPEPSTYGIALGGLALAGAVIRRRRKSA